MCALLFAGRGFAAQARPRAERPEIRIAAAADLQFVMRELSEQYEKQSGAKLSVTYGSSGNFFSQIENGAPFDLFFSADIAYPEKLEAAALAEPGTLCKYAIGRIVIWLPSGSTVNVEEERWDALLNSRVTKIAVANPEHAPYGKAAVTALKGAGIYDRIQEKLIYGESILQAAQFVQSGNAQAGIIALSLAISPAMRDGRYWEIPEHFHSPIEQAAILLKNSKNKETAGDFLTFVKSDRGQEILRKHGFPRAAGVEK